MIQLNPNRKIENVNPDASEKTATNSFTTLDGGLVSALNVAFTPIQDLHGYSKPWAGGAGKNKAKSFVNGTTRSQYDNALWIDSDDLLPDTTYIISGKCGETVNRYYTNENIFTENVYFYSTTGEFSVTVTTVSTLNKSTASQYTADKGWRVLKNAQAQSADPDFDEVMIRLASIADPTFEPYSNICPISGHTEAKSKINNTVYTTSLGTTVYGGELDMVSGDGEQIYDIVDLGDLNWSYESSWGAGADFYTSGLVSLAKLPLTDDDKGNILCTQYENKSRNDFYNSAESAVTLLKGGVLKIRDSRYSDTATFKTAMAGVKLVYELATPTTLILTGQNITAEVGVNNVSAPLDGQEIQTDGVTYKEMFSWADVVAYVQSQVNP